MMSQKGAKSYVDSIDTKLSFYENLLDAPMLLELAIWKSKFTEQLDKNDDTLAIGRKIQCRTDSVMMVTIIVPNVLLPY
jgi:hypothetical protein